MSDTPQAGLVAALARAQAAFPPILKAHTNPHYKSSYADLADVLAAVRPCLNAEGILLSQPVITDDDGRVLLWTILEGHGDIRRSCLPLYLENMTPQQLLSTLTYYRRGMLAAMLGVAAEDDDDGNAAQSAPARQTPRERGFPQHGQTVVIDAGTPVDSYALAAANPPEKPLAAMTAGEMAQYGQSIGVKVSGNKSEIMRQIQPYIDAASGEEPFEVTTNAPVSEGAAESSVSEPEPIPFKPVVHTSGTERKQRDAVADDIREGR